MPDPGLTTELAQKNPKAYAARFKRLPPGDRSAFVGSLSPSAYLEHARALGEKAAVEVMFSMNKSGALDFFQAVFGGLRAKKDFAQWADVPVLMNQVLSALPPEVSVESSPTVPGDAALARPFFEVALPALGWKASEVHFTTSDLSDGGRVRFSFAQGIVTIVGTTGRGEFRAHAAIQNGAAAFEAGWQALAATLGLSWKRT